jgi:hypothetical protein
MLIENSLMLHFKFRFELMGLEYNGLIDICNTTKMENEIVDSQKSKSITDKLVTLCKTM